MNLTAEPIWKMFRSGNWFNDEYLMSWSKEKMWINEDSDCCTFDKNDNNKQCLKKIKWKKNKKFKFKNKSKQMFIWKKIVNN